MLVTCLPFISALSPAPQDTVLPSTSLACLCMAHFQFRFAAKLGGRCRDFHAAPMPTRAQPPHYHHPHRVAQLLQLMNLHCHSIGTHSP